MALPVRPSGNGASKPAPESLPELGAMPDLSSMAMPALTEPPQPTLSTIPEKQASPSKSTRKKQPSPSVADKPNPKVESKLPEGWAIDPATGKKYKKLSGYKEGVMKHSAKVIKAGGMTLDQLRATVNLDEDFNLDDLNGSAETFLSHIRVPPNKEEQIRLREERAKRQKLYDDAASRAAADEKDDESEFDD